MKENLQIMETMQKIRCFQTMVQLFSLMQIMLLS